MKFSFAIYENTILYRYRIAMRPHHPTWSARHVDLVRGGGRFTGLGDQVAVGRTADGEFVTIHAHAGVPVAAAGIHPGEATQVLDVYRLDCRRLRALVDDEFGAGEIAADVDRASPLPLAALDDVEITVVAVDVDRRRAGDLGRWPRRARTNQSNREDPSGGHDSVPHRVTSIQWRKFLGLQR